MGKRLEEFIDIHAGETAWIFGKGPSLDRFDFADAGPLRVTINDLIGVVPDAVYGFSNDRPYPWMDMYKPHHTVFLPKRTAETCDRFPSCEVVVFDDHPMGNESLQRPKLEMCRDLQIREGTLGSVVQVLHIMGVSRVVAVGIDGGNSHAGRAKWRTQLWNEHYKQYNTIKRSFVQACELLGMELQFFQDKQGNIKMKDGYKTVCMTANIFVRGIPYSDGAVVQLQESDARDVIHAGRGYIVEQKQVVDGLETASIRSATETPEKRVTRRPRRMKK